MRANDYYQSSAVCRLEIVLGDEGEQWNLDQMVNRLHAYHDEVNLDILIKKGDYNVISIDYREKGIIVKLENLDIESNPLQLKLL